MNDGTIEIVHVALAHTEGDSMVRFKEANIMHLGEFFFSGMYPFFGVTMGARSGRRIDWMIAALDRALTMMDEKTKVLPGQGLLSSRADVEASREML